MLRDIEPKRLVGLRDPQPTTKLTTLTMANVAVAAKAYVARTATSWMRTCCGLPSISPEAPPIAATAKTPVAMRAPRAADAVHGEDVERVVDPDPLAQQRRAVAQGTGHEADGHGAAGRRRSPMPA